MDIFPLEERIARLRLARSRGVGPITFSELLTYFGDGVKALEAFPELARRGGRRGKIRLASRNAALLEMETVQNLENGQMIFFGEALYPKLLSHIDSAPPVLSAVGHPHLLEKTCVAIVGTRRASASGLVMAERIARELGEANHTIVSGLALGIDGAAHRASLETGTVAALAGGVDIVYPPEHADLHKAIALQGCILSEMPAGAAPKTAHFPRRNRIISGLSLAVVIVEAPFRSGAMITARTAAEQGRIVCAVPSSPVDPRSQGTLALLRDLAKLVRNGEDVMEEIQLMREPPLRETQRSESQTIPGDLAADQPSENIREKILSLLSPTPITIDELIGLSGEEPRHVSVVLMELLCAGRLMRETGQRVSLLPPQKEDAPDEETALL